MLMNITKDIAKNITKIAAAITVAVFTLNPKDSPPNHEIAASNPPIINTNPAKTKAAIRNKNPRQDFLPSLIPDTPLYQTF
jgi:hypothetical protein